MRVGGVVEIDEVAGADVDGADAEAHLAGVDAVEIDQALQRRLERRGVVEARRLRLPAGLKPRRQRRGLKKPGAPPSRAATAPLVERLAAEVALGEPGIGSDRRVEPADWR